MSGIVRKIDELGRIVIPKEIRKVMSIKQGSAINIQTNGDCIILKKFCPIKTIDEYVDMIVNSLYDFTGYATIVCGQDRVVACAGISKGEFVNKPLKNNMPTNTKCIYNNEVFDIVDNQSTKAYAMCIVPILVQGNMCGNIVLIDKTNKNKQISDNTQDIVKCMARYIGNLLD